jgi:choline dehydrogenase
MMHRKQPSDPSRSVSLADAETLLTCAAIDRRTFMRHALAAGASLAVAGSIAERAMGAQSDQARRPAELQEQYDFVVCGAGASGCVVARRLADMGASVLLLEGGGSDDRPSIRNPGVWFTNIGGALDWGYTSQPNPAMHGRSILLPTGKVLGGGTGINAMVWSRGHKNDFDFWAEAAGDAAWNYQSVLKIYRRIEDWQGTPDTARRGTGGLMWVQPAKDPNPIAPAMLRAASASGIPAFEDQNGVMMEGAGGCAIANTVIKNGERYRVATAYLNPVMDRRNLTVLTGATATRVMLRRTRATGLQFLHDGKVKSVGAAKEVILCAGALGTPKILMLSGIGDEQELRRIGIPLAHHLPGVGANFQDHVLVGGCVWEYQTPQAPRNNAAECTFFWKSDSSLETPDLQPFQIEIPFTSEVTSKRYPVPQAAWTIAPGLVRPHSRGRVRLKSAALEDGLVIESNFLAEAADLKALVRGVELCREIGNSAEMREFVKREIMPGPIVGTALEDFIRDAAGTYFHETGTCKMGRDAMSVVDSHLKVRGIDGLRVACGAIMPRITTGNTMAPCIIIGERMGEILRASYA